MKREKAGARVLLIHDLPYEQVEPPREQVELPAGLFRLPPPRRTSSLATSAKDFFSCRLREGGGPEEIDGGASGFPLSLE
ncbi:MAG: hypothetical protein V2A56_03140 [bacterium]